MRALRWVTKNLHFAHIKYQHNLGNIQEIISLILYKNRNK